jgi:hypothetical protein
MISSDFRRLHASHKSSIFLSVLLPPLETGTMWSYSRRSLLPHCAQRPLSRAQTARRTPVGIPSLLSSCRRCRPNAWANSASSLPK